MAKELGLLLTSLINEFPNINWNNVHYKKTTNEIIFTGPNYNDCCENGKINNIKKLALQDNFFSKIHQVRRMIINCGFDANLIKNEINNNNKICQARIMIK